MKAFELRKKSGDEMRNLLQAMTARREEISISIRQKKEKNVKALHSLKKDIARVQTILKELSHKH